MSARRRGVTIKKDRPECGFSAAEPSNESILIKNGHYAGRHFHFEGVQAVWLLDGKLVGSNFIPSSAINELEMWQAETFDLPTIDRELGWAQDLGFTSMR